MKVKMLITRRATEDGFQVKLFEEGEIYDIREHLALAFMQTRACKVLPPERYFDYLYKNHQLGESA